MISTPFFFGLSELFPIGRINMVRRPEQICIHTLNQIKHYTPISHAHLMLQFAKMLGAEVIITSSSDEKLELAQRLGADHAINYRSEPDWAKAARRLTNGRGVDHVVEVGGADTLQQSIASVALGGHIHLIGVLSGFVNDLNVAEVFATNARLHGITVGSRLMFENMIRAMALHETHPIIDRTLDITECREAFSLMERGGHFGKIVVTH